MLVAISLHNDFSLCATEVNGYQQLFGYPHFQNIFFCVQHKKEEHTGLEWLKGE